MNNKILFGQYYNADSWIHRLDPRTKLISLFLFMIGIIFIRNMYFLLGVFGVVILLVLTTKIPIIRFLQSLRIMLFLFIFTAFFQIIFSDIGTVVKTFDFTMTLLNLIIAIVFVIFFVFSKKFIRKHRLFLFLGLVFVSLLLQSNLLITKELFRYSIVVRDYGLRSTGFIILRIVSLILISSLLTLTTKPTDLNNGLESVMSPLEKIGIKTSILAMMISIALRFIPTLINEAERILKAQASRGVDFNEGRLGKKILQIVSLLIPMLFVAIKRAEDLANAMEARGYIPGEHRTKLYELRFRAIDYISLFISVAFLVVAIASRFYVPSTM